MLSTNFFGCYITREGLEELERYSYRGSGSTPIDRLLNPWWEWVTAQLPLWISPNLLTLLGFACTLLCMVCVTVWMPHLEEAAPRQVYWLIAALLFVYQTLDAVDGKQARRTNTSTPLGQLLDHGCDAFSTIFVIFTNLGIARIGLGLYAYFLLAILQMQLLIYTWWELHFNVYRCHTGITGVTEGQLVTIGVALLAGICGSDVYLLTLAQLLSSIQLKNAASLLPRWLLQLRVQYIVSFPFYMLLLYMLLSDVYNGCRRVPNKFSGIGQLVGFFSHVLFQFAFYSSELMVTSPGIAYALIIANSSILVLRMSVAAVCKLRLMPIQWPVLPFYVASIYFYCATPSRTSPLRAAAVSPLSQQQQQQRNVVPYVLLALSIWSTLYLYDFIATNISVICAHLNVTCFQIGQQQSLLKPQQKRPLHKQLDDALSEESTLNQRRKNTSAALSLGSVGLKAVR